MEWDSDYGAPSLVSSGWPDAAELAGALMADSLANSPARKRKLFGSQGTMSPGRAAAKNNAAGARQLAGLPSNKRARMSHSHPLSRSSASPPRQPSPFLRQPSQVRRSPSPVQIIRSNATSTNLHNSDTAISQGNGSLAPDARTCISCRRTATSLLQLAKFHKCSLCGGLSCPICSRSCRTSEDLEADSARKHRYALSPGEDSDNSTRRSAFSKVHPSDCDSHVGSCGKPVCRGCSVESPDGTVQCYRCHAAPPQ